jgi:tight adherence protein C
MLTFSSLLIGLLLVGVGLFGLIASLRYFRNDDVSSRLATFVVQQDTQAKRWAGTTVIRSRELTGSLVSRMVLPWLRGVARSINRLTPAGALDDIGHQLVLAGHPYGLGAREFIGLHMGFSMLGMLGAYLVVRRAPTLVNILIGIMIFLFAFILPILWLRLRVAKRQVAIRKDLPDALDMLSVCATAGLGFDQSLKRVSEYWNTQLSAEFGRVINEMEMGLSRQEAMRNLANRVNVSELNSFISLILQADQLGMSISNTLMSQAEQIRVERRFRAQEEARKIPIKMLIPMAFLIFPAILAVVLGPAIPTLLGFIGTFGR